MSTPLTASTARTVATGLLGLTLLVPVAGCADDAEPAPGGTGSAEPTAEVTPEDETGGTDAATGEATEGSTAEPDDMTSDGTDDETDDPGAAGDGTSADDDPTAGSEDGWGTEAQQSADFPSGGGDLLPVGVRTGVHDDFERVVLDLEGTGEPGWRVAPVDVAIEDPRGTEVDLDGTAILEVILTGVRIPEPEEYDSVIESGPVAPGSTEVVSEVYVTGIFEGQMQGFVALTDDRPFRVFTLDDPVRLVVDVRTED